MIDWSREGDENRAAMGEKGVQGREIRKKRVREDSGQKMRGIGIVMDEKEAIEDGSRR